MQKRSLLGPRGQTNRAQRLIDGTDAGEEYVQIMGAVIELGDMELLQTKLWRHGVGWVQIVHDEGFNLVAQVGPCNTERESFDLLNEALERKGYLSKREDLHRRRSIARLAVSISRGAPPAT